MEREALLILKQISNGNVRGCISGSHAMMCWGMYRVTDFWLDGEIGLSFEVSGLELQGFMLVLRTQSDTYKILHFEKWHRKWIEIASDVRAEDLSETLDILIEGRQISHHTHTQ